MNRKKVFNTVGLMLEAEAALLLLPLLVALIYRERCVWSLAASAAIALALGWGLRRRRGAVPGPGPAQQPRRQAASTRSARV